MALTFLRSAVAVPSMNLMPISELAFFISYVGLRQQLMICCLEEVPSEVFSSRRGRICWQPFC